MAELRMYAGKVWRERTGWLFIGRERGKEEPLQRSRYREPKTRFGSVRCTTRSNLQMRPREREYLKGDGKVRGNHARSSSRDKLCRFCKFPGRNFLGAAVAVLAKVVCARISPPPNRLKKLASRLLCARVALFFAKCLCVCYRVKSLSAQQLSLAPH